MRDIFLWLSNRYTKDQPEGGFMAEWFKIPWDKIEEELEVRVGEVFDKVFDTLDDCEVEVQKYRSQFSNYNENALACEIIADTSKRTSVIGGVSAAPALVPGLGWSVMIATLAGDYALTLREEMGMFLKFSFLYEVDVDYDQRKKDVITLLLFLARDKKKTPFAKEVLEDLQKEQIDVLARKILIRAGVQLGIRFFRRKLLSILPGIGIVLSGGVNYLGTKSVGKLATQYFQDKAEFIRVHGQSDSNVTVTQRASIQMMINLGKMAGDISDQMRQSIQDQMDIFGYTEEQQKPYMDDFEKRELTPISVKDIRAMSEEDRRYVLKQGLKFAGSSLSVKQENYLDFITRAFGMTELELKKMREEIFAETIRES
jgi:hypothetical protein